MDIAGFLKTIDGLAENTKGSYEQTLWQVNTVAKGNEPTDDEVYHFLKGYCPASLHRQGSLNS